MHPMQPNINLYLFSYKSLCIYAMHASYANEYINLYIFCSMSLCIYAMHASYADKYINLYVFSFKSLCIYTFFVTIKNLYVFSYKSLCISAMLASYSVVNKICIYFVLWVYASMLRMHPMQPYTNFYIFCSMSLCIYATHASHAALYKLLYILFYESMHLCYACILCF